MPKVTLSHLALIAVTAFTASPLLSRDGRCADIDAQAKFEISTSISGTYLLQAAPDDVLVFHGSDTPMVLNGANLVIKAAQVRLEGLSVIRAYSTELTRGEPAPKGGTAGRGTDQPTAGRCPGGNGCDGTSGGGGHGGAFGTDGNSAGRVLLI